MPFPLAKLLALGLRQASRHVAAFVKNRAKNHEGFKNALVKSAGWYHSLQTKSKLSILGMGKVKKVQPLSEQAAIDLGVEIINDLVLIVCGLAIYLFIESRPSKSKDRDDTCKPEDIEKLKQVLLMQKLELERQSAKISRLERIIVVTAGTSKLPPQILMDSTKQDTEINRKCTITEDEIIIEDTVK